MESRPGNDGCRGGPFGNQIDVFDSIPGNPEYTSIRHPYMVTWSDTATPHILTSVAEIKEAEVAGELTIMKTNVVVNVPIVR